jgi:ubiquinone/menaquinone biosynthesis C-methylase UbiE
MSTSTELAPPAEQDIHNPFFARLYRYVFARGEGKRMRRARGRLLEGLSGRVVEIGPGAGINFDNYPPGVSEVIAVEPEPYLRELAERAAAQAPVSIQVTGGTAEAIPVEDASVDAVVLCLVLCSVPDQAQALAEARRVLRPGGEIRVLEHVVAENPVARGIQKAADVTFWPRLLGGCHPNRDTRAALAAAGFDISDVKRFVMQGAPTEPPLPFILGRCTT